MNGFQIVKKEPVIGCPSCGWKGKPGDNFCARCGTKLEEM
jgi:DNA-directed RNA polymerase subunit RPC12/RpoP